MRGRSITASASQKQVQPFRTIARMGAPDTNADRPHDTRKVEFLHAHLERLERQNDQLAERLLEAEQAVAERIQAGEEAAANLSYTRPSSAEHRSANRRL